MVQTANDIWRDFQTAGVPASGRRKPPKPDIREWGTRIEQVVELAAASGGGVLAFATRAALDAELDYDADQAAWVVADTTPANNGLYRKIGASGSGSWSRLADLPFSVIRLVNAGAGSANLIVATSNFPVPAVDGAALLVFNASHDSSSTIVNIAINGAPALQIKTAAGNNPAPGGIAAGTLYAGLKIGSTFTLLSDQPSAAIQAACEASLATFQSLVLGVYDSDPATDPNGQPLQTGAIYFNDASEVWKYYDGTAWQTFPYATVADGAVTNIKVASPANPSLGILASKLSHILPFAGATWRSLSDLISEAPVTPESFGAVGDGVADDTEALQRAANYVCRYGGTLTMRATSSYKIAGTITFRPQLSAGYSPPYNPPSDLIFLLPNKPFATVDLNGALVTAAAPMASMFEVAFDGDIPETAPFFIRIVRGRMNGNGNAEIGIYSNWCLGCDINQNIIWGVERCIKAEGYGVHHVWKNLLRFSVCGIDVTAGGADSLYIQNDFYTAQGAPNGGACFLIGNQASSQFGASRIFSNAATNESQSSMYFIRADASASGNVIRNLSVAANTISGFDRLIYARGMSGARNLKYWHVTGNNAFDYGAKTSLGVIDSAETEGWRISDNSFNPMWAGSTRSSLIAIAMTNSTRDRISGNYLARAQASGIRVDFGNRTEISGNHLYNCGDSGNAAIALASASQRNLVYGNTIDNDDAVNFCQVAVAEGAGGDWNSGTQNMINNVPTKYSTVGANTTFT